MLVKRLKNKSDPICVVRVVVCTCTVMKQTPTAVFLRRAPDAARWDGMLWAGALFFVDSRLCVELPPVFFLFPCHRFVVVRLDSLPQRNSDCLCAIAWLHFLFPPTHPIFVLRKSFSHKFLWHTTTSMLSPPTSRQESLLLHYYII